MTENIRKKNIRQENQLLIYLRKFSKVIIAIIFFVLGLATSNLVANWTNFNTIFSENPLMFWMISVFLSSTVLLCQYTQDKKRNDLSNTVC